VSKIDVPFLKEVQARGWVLKRASEETCIGMCPHKGCGMAVLLAPDKPIPSRVEPVRETGFRVESSIEAQSFLRSVREELCLAQAEVDEAAGLAEGHIAKAEQVPPTRTVSIDTLSEWAQALGVEIWLVRRELPQKTLRQVVQTRGRVVVRTRRNERR
jgi:hypothetical protein